jgi:hypothetical protein
MRKCLLASILLGLLCASPAQAQLVGTDTAPGSSCAGYPDGATRTTADADLNGAEVVLVCDGTNWLSAPSAAAGADRQVQFNSGGALSGDGNFSFSSSGLVSLYKNDSSVAGGNLLGLSSYMDVIPAAAQTAGRTTAALDGGISVGAGTQQVRAVRGINAYAGNAGTGPIESLKAVNAYAGNTAAATITGFEGGWFGAASSAGTITEMSGLIGQATVSGGTVTTLNGVRATVGQTGGTVTNRHGIYIAVPSGTATNDWGIYQAGAQNNYLGGGLVMAGDVSPASIGANQNNYAPTGHATASVLRLTASAAYNVTGLAGGVDGRILTIMNVGTNTITLKNQDAASTAANRFAFGTDLVLSPDRTVGLIYDSTSQRWRAGGGLPFESIARLVSQYSTDTTPTAATCTAPSCPAGYRSAGCAVADQVGSTASTTIRNAAYYEAYVDGETDTNSSCSYTHPAPSNIINAVVCLRVCVR